MSFTKYLTSNNFCSHIIVLLLSSLLLSSCGLSGEKGGTNGQTANNQNGNSGGGNSEEDDLFVSKETIGIHVERINGETTVNSTTQISIVSLNDAFREFGSSSLPAFRVIKREGLGNYEIQLDKAYVEKINQVVKVVFNNVSTPKEIFYAPLYTLASKTEYITVNAKSHYLLKKLFDEINSSTQLNELLPCVSTTTSCVNQAEARANILRQTNDAVSTYKAAIPLDANVDEAMSYLDQLFDLRKNVEAAVNEIIHPDSPFAKGTRRSYDALTQPPPYSQRYHSVFFGIGLSDLKPNDTTRSVSINSVSSIIDDSPINNKSFPYPVFDQSTSLLDLRKDTISSNIPFSRTSLNVFQNSSLSLIETEDVNYLTSFNTVDSHLSKLGYLINGRSFSKTTPSGTSGSTFTGWEFNPYFTRAYQSNEYEPPIVLDNDHIPDYGNAPTWLTSSNYSKSASYRLSGTKEPYSRDEQLEDMHLFSWEVHGLETNKDPGFTVSTMNNKEYGAISYSIKLNDENNTNAIQLIAETAKWDINASTNSGTIFITQPSNHYKTLSLSRAANNFTVGVKTETNLLDSPRTVFRKQSQDADNLPYHGLISLSNPGSDQPQGHSTANGSYMAFSFNTKLKSDPLDRGQGIILASELASFNYLFSGEKYLIQGNSMEMTSEKNIIHQLNDSTLTIEPAVNIPNSECIANITVKRTTVEHTLGTLENTLSEPIESEQDTTFSQLCTIDGSEIYIEFDNIFNETLILRGFITQKNDELSNSPGNLLNLIWQQENQLGLVFAQKEQDLSPTFD